MESRTPAERALYALDLLGDPPLARSELADLLGLARTWLAEFTRALLALEGEMGLAAVDADAGTLRKLAGVRAEVPVVTEMCVECDRIAGRRLDLSGAGRDTAVWSLCDTHARLEAETIRRSRSRSRSQLGRTLAEAEPASAPQLPLPLRPALKKVRHASADRLRRAH